MVSVSKTSSVVFCWLVTYGHVLQIKLPVPLCLLLGTVVCLRTQCAWSESCWCWTLSRGSVQERCWSHSVSSLPRGKCPPCWMSATQHGDSSSSWWIHCCWSLTLLSFTNHRQSVSSLSGPLQVVPDIDDQVNHPEHLQEVDKYTFCSVVLH